MDVRLASCLSNVLVDDTRAISVAPPTAIRVKGACLDKADGTYNCWLFTWHHCLMVNCWLRLPFMASPAANSCEEEGMVVILDKGKCHITSNVVLSLLCIYAFVCTCIEIAVTVKYRHVEELGLSNVYIQTSHLLSYLRDCNLTYQS